MTAPIPWDPMAPASTAEVRMQLLQTEAFIGANPTSIVVERATVSKTSVGGRARSVPTLLPPTVVRLIPQSAAGQRTDEGEVSRIDYILLALPDADIQRGDRFKLVGEDEPWYTINRMHDALPYEIRGEVSVVR